MELVENEETGVLEQVAQEIVDHDEVTGKPIEEPYVLRHVFPARPHTMDYREAIFPYVALLVSIFVPDDITF